MGQPGVLFSRSRGSTKMGLPLRSPVAKLSCEAATEENAKRRSFMPRTQVTGKANFSPGITSGLPVTRVESHTASNGPAHQRDGLGETLYSSARASIGDICAARCDGSRQATRHTA